MHNENKDVGIELDDFLSLGSWVGIFLFTFFFMR